jgi:hypothetical protein
MRQLLAATWATGSQAGQEQSSGAKRVRRLTEEKSSRANKVRRFARLRRSEAGQEHQALDSLAREESSAGLDTRRVKRGKALLPRCARRIAAWGNGSDCNPREAGGYLTEAGGVCPPHLAADDVITRPALLLIVIASLGDRVP